MRALVVLAVAACLVAFARPSAAQNYVGPCSDFAGCTTWNCAEPAPWIHLDAQDFDGREATTMIMHELRHVAQARAMGCEQWNAAWHDRTGMLTDWKVWQEADAYCTSARTAVSDHLFTSLYAAIETFGVVLSRYGYPGITAYEAARRIGVICHVDIRP